MIDHVRPALFLLLFVNHPDPIPELVRDLLAGHDQNRIFSIKWLANSENVIGADEVVLARKTV